MANLYDLKKFDLNLLVIFECIYQHLSISRAAETLYITPSAVSQSLQRLREALADRLVQQQGHRFDRRGHGVGVQEDFLVADLELRLFDDLSVDADPAALDIQLGLPARTMDQLDQAFGQADGIGHDGNTRNRATIVLVCEAAEPDR